MTGTQTSRKHAGVSATDTVVCHQCNSESYTLTHRQLVWCVVQHCPFSCGEAATGNTEKLPLCLSVDSLTGNITRQVEIAHKTWTVVVFIKWLP